MCSESLNLSKASISRSPTDDFFCRFCRFCGLCCFRQIFQALANTFSQPCPNKLGKISLNYSKLTNLKLFSLVRALVVVFLPIRLYFKSENKNAKIAQPFQGIVISLHFLGQDLISIINVFVISKQKSKVD